MYFVVYYSYLKKDTIFSMHAEGYDGLEYVIKYIQKNLGAQIEYIKISKEVVASV